MHSRKFKSGGNQNLWFHLRASLCTGTPSAFCFLFFNAVWAKPTLHFQLLFYLRVTSLLTSLQERTFIWAEMNDSLSVGVTGSSISLEGS